MKRRAILGLSLVLCLTWPFALRAAGVADVARALQFERLFVILSQEGLRNGRDLQDEMFPGEGTARWQATLAALHDPERMAAIATAALEDELAGQEEATKRIVAWFEAEPGARILALELAAREALQDETVQQAAEEAWETMLARDDPRLERIGRFIAAGDLIERNVAGALNSNMAFYRGMIEGGAIDEALPDGDMMADLWSQEGEVRDEAESWLWPYLLMAYQPLTDDQMDRYIAFSESPDGILLNTALFSAFDALFVQLSHDLGLAVAGMLDGQDI